MNTHTRLSIILFSIVMLSMTIGSTYPAIASIGGKPLLTNPTLETDHVKIAKLLSDADIWILPQPKSAALINERFDLAWCKGIRLVGCNDSRLRADLPALLRERSGVHLGVTKGEIEPGYISLVLVGRGPWSQDSLPMDPGDLRELGEQGYYLRVDQSGVTAAATSVVGLYYAGRTLAQIAADRKVLPGIVVRDWPSMRYRGFQYDINRGQMPRLQTLERLADVTAEAKMNMFELYIEDGFQWQRHPDIASPEAMTQKETRELCDHSSRYYMETHPFMQTFGHFYSIGSKPAYRKFMVPDGGTVDIRKPESVAFVMDLLDEVCDAFPGKLLNVDITEINDTAFKESGTTQEQLTDLTLQYAVKIRDTVAKHGKRLMIAQSQLGAEGTLAGLGSVVEKLPKDIIVGSYYTAEFYGGWEKDYPRLKGLGIEFLSQPWIDSHGHIMPYTGHAMDFSDISITRGLQYGAVGSTTCDWGDDGHYHLPGTTWYPFLYHAASAWTGAKLDRSYFDKAFCRLIFGTGDDSIARAINLAGNINGQSIGIKDAASGKVWEPPYTGNSRFGRYYYEFFGDPFTDAKILDIAEPGKKGAEILEPAQQAVTLFEKALPRTARNKDILEQLLFTSRNYVAMGRKLIARAQFLDQQVPRAQVAGELESLADTYESLKTDFSRYWLNDCKDAGSFQGYLGRYNNCIEPCRKKAGELLGK